MGVIYPARMKLDSFVERAALDQVCFGRADGKVILSRPISWRRILNIPVRRAPDSSVIRIVACIRIEQNSDILCICLTVKNTSLSLPLKSNTKLKILLN